MGARDRQCETAGIISAMGRVQAKKAGLRLELGGMGPRNTQCNIGGIISFRGVARRKMRALWSSSQEGQALRKLRCYQV